MQKRSLLLVVSLCILFILLIFDFPLSTPQMSNSRRKDMKKWLKISLLIIAIMVPLALVGGSFYMLEYSLGRPTHFQMDEKTRYAHVMNTHPEIKPWLDSLLTHHLLHDTVVTMQNGEQHFGVFAYAPQPSRKTAILLHGYTDTHANMMMIAHIYAKMGYNVLLPDHHAHGQSEGKRIQMGWKERKDVLRWMAIADSLFSDSLGHSEQVVHGISMGAALTMCVSGERTPDYVKCFVEDCGYTSVWDEFENELKVQFGLPAFPLLYTASALNKLRDGWSFQEASPLRQVAKCHKPMLFIHGDKDSYVQTKMVYPLYKAKPAPKQLWIGKGSKHAESYQDHRKEYSELVRNFVSRYIH